MATQSLNLTLRHQTLTRDTGGHNMWQVTEETRTFPADQTALLLCDVWDNHWSRGAVERENLMVPRMNDVVKSVRDRGVRIVHAPSGTMDFYRDTSARRRIVDIPPVTPPDSPDHDAPPLPVDASDGGSDTGEAPDRVHTAVWTRQHPGIEVDQERDVISDKGAEVYGYMQQEGIQNLLIMGVHTNMCVLNRSFAIKQMVRWGKTVALVRDLTDAMYNPAKPPYVSHAEGTRLVIEYIEKFWCPTLHSRDLL